MSQLTEILVIALPSLAIGFMLGRESMAVRLAKAEYAERQSNQKCEVAAHQLRAAIDLMHIPDSELVRRVADGLIGSNGPDADQSPRGKSG